jgi:hypothetical protein
MVEARIDANRSSIIRSTITNDLARFLRKPNIPAGMGSTPQIIFRDSFNSTKIPAEAKIITPKPIVVARILEEGTEAF